MSTVPSPAVAAVLSLVFPGLGQVYAGARQRGVVLAAPWVLLLVGVLAAVAGGMDTLLPIFFSTQIRTALLVLLVAVFFYHVAAVLDAYNVALRARRESGVHTSSGSVAIVVLLVAIMLVPYGALEVVGIQASTTMSGLFRGDNQQPDNFIPRFEEPSEEPVPATPAAPSPTPTTAAPGSPSPASPTPAGPSPSPTPVPPVYGPIDAAWAENGRLDLLLVGSDSGVGRSSIRTDTMILLSVEIETGRAAMFGFPRNMTGVPLPQESAGARPGGIFDDMLSALWRRAAESQNFVGSEGIGQECQYDFACERGWRALAGSIQQMAGVQIDGIIAVDLYGFTDLVDAVGGVWIDVPARVHDPRYPTQDGTRIEIDIEPGCQKLDGTLALAYARSRRQDSDYQRMRRQQVVLQAIRRQFDPLALLPRVPELLNIARDNLFTTIDEDDIPLMAQVAQRVDADQIQQGRFVRLRNVTPESLVEIRQRVRNVFDEPWVEPSPTPDEPGERCPPR
jgi:LCP family protein required for cell wall assembly